MQVFIKYWKILINIGMPRLSLWNPVKTNDYRFIDRTIGEYLFISGVGVNVHKYIGIHDMDVTGDPSRPGGPNKGETYIQDVLFLENRDRKYDKNVAELRGQYTVQDNDAFDLTQFGAFLANDTLFINFHIESMVRALGRKLMPGDVLEMPHLRDDLLLGSDDAINRFYVVTDGSRPGEGFDPRWWPHLWKVKVGPISDSQEYRDILGSGEEEGDLRNLLSTYGAELDINEKILEQAANDVPYDSGYFEGAHLYFDPEDGRPRIGTPSTAPNGVEVRAGISFPQDAREGEYFLRTDFMPNRLFQKDGNRWRQIADDGRGTWSAGNRVLDSFINNENIVTYNDGTRAPEKQYLSQSVKPRADN